MEPFRELPGCLIMLSLGDGAFGELQTSSVSFHGSQAAGLHCSCKAVGFEGLFGTWEWEEQGKLKYYKLSVTEIPLLFLTKFSSDCLCLISRVLKKLNLTIFVSVLAASMGDADFLRSFFLYARRTWVLLSVLKGYWFDHQVEVETWKLCSKLLSQVIYCK